MTVKRKKVFLVSIALALVAMLAVGATLAYLTDVEKVLNTLGIGSANPEGPDAGKKTVDIALTEDKFDALTNNTKQLYDIVPGDMIMKDPTVKNTGIGPVYVRVKLYSDDTAAATQLTPQDLQDLFGATVDSANWTYHAATNTFYYTSSGNHAQLAKDASVAFLTEKTGGTGDYTVSGNYTMQFPTTLTYETINESGGTLKLHIVAEAVQAANYTPDSMGSSDPWGNVGHEIVSNTAGSTTNP